jgi:2-methylcitrate dehydratase PrpD
MNDKTQTQVQALAKYAARANFDDLSAESREQLPIHILDSLGCCIAALGAGPIEACREQVAEFGGMPAKITFEHEVQDYPGLPCHPFTWEDSVEKFDQLVTGRIDGYLSEDIKDAVRSLESIRVNDLTKLLNHVQVS